MHMQSDFRRSATQGQPVWPDTKLWCFRWNPTMSPLYIYIFHSSKPWCLNCLRDISKVCLCYTAGVFIIVKAKFRWTKPLPTRLHCLSLLDQKLQVPSVETFLLCITVHHILWACFLRPSSQSLGMLMAMFTDLIMAFLSLLVSFNLLIIHSLFWNPRFNPKLSDLFVRLFFSSSRLALLSRPNLFSVYEFVLDCR